MLKRHLLGSLLVLLALLSLLRSHHAISQRQPRALVRAPRRPYRALVRNNRMYAGYEKGPRNDPGFPWRDGWFPVHIVADAFIDCAAPAAPTLVLLSRLYRRTQTLNHSALVIDVLDASAGTSFRLGPGAWESNGFYESTAIGRYALPLHASREAALACAPAPAPAYDYTTGLFTRPADAVKLRLFYNGSEDYSNYYWTWHEDKGPEKDNPPPGLPYHSPQTAYLNVTRSPEPPRSDIAMVGIFSFSRYLLPVWLSYWRAIGVDTFYLFYNGPREVIEAGELQEELAWFEGNIVLVDWQVLHWISTEPEDVTHGQPIAINTALQRWGHLHRFMAFYDSDELLVTPSHDSLLDYLEDYRAVRGPVVALRSMCSWAKLTHLPQANLTSVRQVRLEHLAVLPVERGKPGGREKYVLNVSAAKAWGIRFINLHGVYSHQGGGAGPEGKAEVVGYEGGLPAYHLHLLNKAEDDLSQINDSRDIFMPQPGEEIRDWHLRDLVRRALNKRIARAQQPQRKL